jgi:hypothetical protein
MANRSKSLICTETLVALAAGEIDEANARERLLAAGGHPSEVEEILGIERGEGDLIAAAEL